MEYWYSYFVIIGTLAMGFLNYRFIPHQGLGVFERLKSKRTVVFKYYIYFFLAGVVIDVVGQHLVHFWIYPSYTLFEKFLNVYVIGYPFAFFLVWETFLITKHFFKAFSVAFIITTLVSAFAHELPNVYAHEWVYAIPYIRYEILHINSVVIIGWSILVAVPILVHKYLVYLEQ